jgi:hypothetical protein
VSAEIEVSYAVMNWIIGHMKWILVISGALTCTMLYAAIAPQPAMQSTFGESLDGPVANIVVRSWGLLIALTGGMLIYAAFNPSVRLFVLTVAGLSKTFFIALVLVAGRQFLDHQVRTAIIVDAAQVIVFGLYILAVRRAARLNSGSGAAAAEIVAGRTR